MLNDIAGFYAAKDEATFKAKIAQLEQRFARLEQRLVAAPWFDGEKFSLVDAVFGPVFRYFDTFDEIGDFGILSGKPKLARWRKSAGRAAVRAFGGERRISGVAARLHRSQAVVVVGIAGGKPRCSLVRARRPSSPAWRRC